MLWLTKGLGPGGAERLLVETARAIDPERVDVTAAYVLTWKDHLAGALEAAGVEAICLSTRRSDPRWPLRLRRLLTTGGFDVMHVHSPLPAAVARAVVRTVPRGDRPAIVATEHNTWTSHHPATRWANRLTGGGDDATFAVTDETLATMRGPAAARATVLVHGIDVAAVEAERAARDEARAELGFGAGDLVVGTVANLRPQKDHPNLLRAVRSLVDRGIDVRVVVVGQGPLEAEITALRDQLGLTDVVTLAGFRPDAVRVMAACDVFVLASAWEGLPVAVMEATALGLPIVATRVGGVAEALSDDDAVLVRPGDPIALADGLAPVLQDDGLRLRLGEASRRVSPRFAIDRAVATLTGCYEELAARRPRPVGDGDANASTPPRRSRRRRTDVEIRPVEPADRDAVIALMGASLGWGDDARHHDLFAWKHDRNPFGPSPGWVAESDGAVVAVRMLMRWEFERGGRTVRAVRAVDTATHPDHQGNGLFTTLTMHALDAARAEGIDMVFNTPNGQSRPGYLKMGWRQVGRLPTAVRPRSPAALARIARAKVPALRWSEPLDVGQPVDTWSAAGRWDELHRARPAVSSTDRSLVTRATAELIAWRYSLPDLAYRVIDDGDAAIVVRLRRRGPASELVVAEQLGDLRLADALAADALAGAGADHAIRLGAPRPTSGFLPLPGGGPILTWRAVTDLGMPPLPNWSLQLRDVELF